MRDAQFGVYMKYLKRIAGIAAAAVIFLGIFRVFNYMYVKDYDWGRILWHNFYEDKGNIDNICIGSSHVYRGIIPARLDELNGGHNFNLASGSQVLNGSYYALKEADRNNSLSHVYLEVFYTLSTKNNFSGNTDPARSYTYNWRNVDYMKFSPNKLEYMFTISKPEKYMDTLMPFVRYRTKLDNWEYVMQTIDYKREEQYRTYEYISEWDENSDDYWKQGYQSSSRTYNDKNRFFSQGKILAENPMGETSEEYLRKILDYCRKRDIDITLFSIPVYELVLISTENYDNFISQVKAIAAEYDVEFYDFNIAKEEYLPIHQGANYIDMNHLNSKGADMFTEFFDKVVSGTASENEEFFYSSYAEKLQSEPADIYGLYYRDAKVEADEESADDGEDAPKSVSKIRTCRIASNWNEGTEYRIILTPNEGDQYVVQEFAENNEFTISPEEHGICTIVARMKDSPDDVKTCEINY